MDNEKAIVPVAHGNQILKSESATTWTPHTPPYVLPISGNASLHSDDEVTVNDGGMRIPHPCGLDRHDSRV